MYIVYGYEFINTVLDAIAYCNRRVVTKKVCRNRIHFQMSKYLLSLYGFKNHAYFEYYKCNNNGEIIYKNSIANLRLSRW